MAIKKIISIKNAGRIKNYSCRGDVELKKVNLFYGENGRGKTTLCAILRSLYDGLPDHITGRTTLGTGGIPSVQLQMESGPINFQNLEWTATVSDIMIFDQDFIAENVYDGNVVGTTQRKNLYKIIIGKKGVQIAETYEETKAKSAELTKSIKQVEASISAHLPSGVTLPYFQNYQADPQIDEHIAAIEKELTAAKESSTIISHREFGIIVLPEIPADLSATLALNLEGLSSEVETKIKEHVEKHGMGRPGQDWLSKGLEFSPGESCPFCGQDTQKNDLINSYRILFGKEYALLKDSITEKGKSFANAFSDAAVIPALSAIEENKNVDLFWKRYCAYTSPVVIDADIIKPLVEEVRTELLKLLRLKVQSPLEPLELSKEAKLAIEKYNALVPIIDDYNTQIAQINKQIQQRKLTVESVNVPALENSLAKFIVLKKRFEEPFTSQCSQLSDLQSQKTEAENDKDTLKEELDNYGDGTITKYQTSINKYLELFNAGFQIGEVKHNYVGGVNANFQIQINDKLIKLGDEKTPRNVASFANTLSSGDKSTLALSFFLAQIEHDPDKSNKIVVLDDPFNSQDSFRRNQTAIQISRIAKCCKQVIVLSHDANFLKQVKDKIQEETVKTMHLVPTGHDNTRLEEMDLEIFLQSGLQKNINLLQMYMADPSQGSADHIVQKIRPLVEEYCRNRCPTRFKESDMLGQILQEIRDGGTDHPLCEIYLELDELNEYSCKFHHPDSPTTSVLNVTELLGYVKRTLRLIGAY